MAPEKNAPRLVLIDGHSIIHRSFHAMKQLAEPLRVRATGELTGAPFGFANTFIHMFGELKPTHVIVTLDKGAVTFRNEIADTYKATRVRMAPEERDEFNRQMDRTKQLIETFGIPLYEKEGYEADDLMGTLSSQAAEEGIDTYLVSMDSDIAQLVRDGVHMWMYRPYQRDSVIFKDANDVLERYGVLPHQMTDLKALKGDTSDNIPGIPGIGDKTAVKLIEQFGSVEEMLEDTDQITSAKQRALVEDHADQIRKSKLLATIVCDVPDITLDMEVADFKGHYDPAKVSDLFRELEFRTLIPRLPEGDGVTPAAAAALEGETSFSIVMDEDELDRVVADIKKQKHFVLDLETTTREPMRTDIVGISLALGAGEAYYIPVGHAPRLGDQPQLPLSVVLEKLAPLISREDVRITGHNVKFDYVVLASRGIEMRGVDFDTMIAAFLVGEGGGAGRPEEGNLSLPWLYARRLGVELPDREALLGKGGKKADRLTIDQAEVETVGDMACTSADAIARLREALEPEIAEKGMDRLFNEIEMPLVSVLARMELAGVAVDTGTLHEMSETLAEEVQRLEEEIYKTVGHEFNIGSPAQLSSILFDEIGLPKTRRLKTGGYATDKDSLEAMREVHPVIDLIFNYRELSKLKSTYLDPLPFLVHPRTHRIHTEFNQTGAATGRLSSSNPNMQNIPVRGEIGAQVRRAFIARDNGQKPQLLSADYSQIELRIMAHITRDPALVGAFERDEDIHAATASQVFGVPIAEVTAEMRRRAKVFNFGVLYGLSEYGLSIRERISREDAAEFIRTYFEKYPGIQEYVSETISKVRNLGYAETLFGRRRYIPEINAGNWNVRSAAERAAINMPVQGTAADIIKIAMNRLDETFRERGLKTWMTLQVHDELIFESPGDELEEVRTLCLEIMPASIEMQVPLKVDTKAGASWGDMAYGDPVDVAAFS
ncbi:MAG TPA: DNA polymerase I [Dehalococcoidia bacterium]|nr:DNA polymerase I [Dehalococcoidia bacterium]